jgi:hypothetical protein
MYTMQGKTRPTYHTLSMLSPRMVEDHTYLTRSTYSNLSHSRQQRWIDSLLPRRRAPDLRVHTQFLSWANHWSSGSKSTLCWRWTTRLTGPINTSMRSIRSILARGGPTHRSLTDIRGGYNIEGVSLPHNTPWPSQLAISTFHLWVPPGLQFNQIPTTKPRCWVERTYGRHVVFWPPGYLSQPKTMPSHS